ncbi:MAG: NUDIX domain-containing protein [Microthrixaceae bacterium]
MTFDLGHGGEVPVRDAATVMLLRDGDAGVEVFMLRRNLDSDFVGGAYVFPGGAVDPSDGDPAVEAISLLSDSVASERLGLDRGGLAYWVAAIRESFEEAGLLMALDDRGAIVRFDSPDVEDRFTAYRRAVDSDERPLRDVVSVEHLVLATDRIHYFSRWITPLGAPRRYDTRFFVAIAPDAQTPLHDDREVIANLWIRPADALARHQAGEFDLIFPTVRSLEALVPFETASEVVEHAAALTSVEPACPAIVQVGGGLRIVMADDEVYDALTARRIDGRELPG